MLEADKLEVCVCLLAWRRWGLWVNGTVVSGVGVVAVGAQRQQQQRQQQQQEEQQ